MRHALILVCLVGILLLAGTVLDAVVRRSPAPGLMVVWTSHPGKMLSSLPGGQVRVVNTWLAGHIVQLHVQSMRDFGEPLAATRLAVRLPEAISTLAGCG